MWVHARRLTGRWPRRVRAGPDFEKNPAILYPDPIRDPMQSPIPYWKIDHFAILANVMSMYVVMLLMS